LSAAVDADNQIFHFGPCSLYSILGAVFNRD
jgi:hypothetical protein